MSPPAPPPDPSGPESRKSYGDPWQAFGYVVAGVGFYGVIGWLLDRWWGTSFLVAIGIFTGAALGIYMTVKRFGTVAPPPDPQAARHGSTRTEE